jgi:hypothetical protein
MRLHATTQKVRTNYGSHYVSVMRDTKGTVCEIAISSPGKFDNSALNDFVIQLQDAINEVLAQ